MRRTLHVEQAVDLLFQMSDEETLESSSSDNESVQDDFEDPDFVAENVSDDDDDEQPGPSTAPTPTTSRRRPSQRGRGRKDQAKTRSRSPAQSAAQPEQSSEPWKTETDPDTAPQASRFMPRRPPGAQVDLHSGHTPKDLFLLYFAADTMRTICRNTNKQAARNQQKGSKYQWTDVDVEELHRFLGLLIYTSLVTLPSIQDYWKQSHILSVSLPAKVMPRDRFRSISWNIHLSDPEEDVINDQRKGTPQHDKLFRVKPLMDDIRTACQAHYHPKKELSVDERMVATKAKTGMTQYMKDKPNKWGIKLFVLAESNNGYTLNFNVYVGKAHTPSVHGLSYDAVMDLIQPSHLGTGYHIYMDNFNTSPKLFLSLGSMKFGACGTYRSNRKGCPSGRENALTSKSKRGSVRWIREDRLVFVKWMDTREVSVCSTIHPAFSGETIKRKVKEGPGRWVAKTFPALPPSWPTISTWEGLTCQTSFSSITQPIAELLAVMPFGLRNAPATFQRLMNRVVSGLEGCAVYLDDVVIYSDSWEEHVCRVQALFERLVWARLTINLAKYEFAKGTVTYLGKVVGQGVVCPVEAKVQAVKQFPQPSTKKELMRFLVPGLLSLRTDSQLGDTGLLLEAGTVQGRFLLQAEEGR
ncbi:piggyBac transposable element-derived protein 3-like [Coregonus clupeaformis]|uniref:piggyBac transposable element-derived protein 3-like n=1 Tax=Coregonus clupeaformis TaxID=59861 RepID=UPI001E1C4E11|nr:piggyBac transposable element-derived protein 3-like [Coregonus clupeaformis]